MVPEANGNGRVFPKRTTRGSSAAPAATAKDVVNNGNGNYGAFDRTTPVRLVGSYRQRSRYSDIVSSKVNACRAMLHACKDKTASMYHHCSQGGDGDTDGP